MPAARAVGRLLAPVVACLRGDDEGFDVLLGQAVEDGTVAEVVRAAPDVTRVYLRLAPPPDGPEQILASFGAAARGRFDAGAVALGAGCLAAARAAHAAPPARAAAARTVYVLAALDFGDRAALEGAVASCWWAAYGSACLRGVDPVEETRAICHYTARLDAGLD